VPAGVALTLVSLLVGWLALAPARRRIGTLGYHLAAIPVGLLGWVVCSAAAMALGVGFGWLLVIVGLAAWVALVAGCTLWVTRSFGEPHFAKVPWWSYIVVLGVLATFSWAVATAGITAYSADGWSQYVPDGMVMSEIGKTSGRALGHRMVLLTAVHAGYFALGGEFPYVIHPVMGLVTAGLLFAGVWWAAARSSRLVRGALAAIVTTLLVSNAVYLFMSLYIHSHMITAMYILAAIVATGRAVGWLGRERAGSSTEPTWLVIAGLATAAVVLARPDGAAYSLIPFAVAAAVLVRVRAQAAEVDAYFAPLVGTSALVTAGAMAQTGVWESDKLPGIVLLAFIGAQAMVWIALRWLSGRDTNWLARGTNAVRAIVALDVPVLLVVWRRAGEQGVAAVQNMTANLLSQGGYRFVWPYAAGVLGMSVALRPRTTRNPYTAYVLFAIVQFFAVALAVHALTHPGRLGWGDSFNRVAFHILPVVYLYAGLYVSELVAAVTGQRD